MFAVTLRSSQDVPNAFVRITAVRAKRARVRTNTFADKVTVVIHRAKRFAHLYTVTQKVRETQLKKSTKYKKKKKKKRRASCFVESGVLLSGDTLA